MSKWTLFSIVNGEHNVLKMYSIWSISIGVFVSVYSFFSSLDASRALAG